MGFGSRRADVELLYTKLKFYKHERYSQSVICSVVLTRGLKRITIAISLSSSEISTAAEKATQKAV